MKVLVTGAGGFLGRYVVKRLLKRGHSVRAIVRPTSPIPNWPKEVEIFRADLRTKEDLSAAFVDIEAVIHLAAATSGSEELQFASTVTGTEHFMAAMVSSRVRRLILVSSLVVYDWSRALRRLDEETPLLRDIYPMGAYTIAKAWQERVVARVAKAHGFELTVMRPGFVWGSQHAQIAGMGRRIGRAYVIFGPFTRLPLTYVENCADCLAAAVDCPAAIGETFNVIDDDSIRVWHYVSEYAKRSGQQGIMVPVPYQLGLALAQLAALVSQTLFGKRGKLPSLLTPRRFEAQFKPVRFDTAKLQRIMHWQPPQSFNESLEETYGQIP
jgi:nucleoside-diphosphate-sugar epimerase